MIIGYLGPEGSYSYEAALSCCRGADLRKLNTFREIFNAVEAGIVDKGVLPIENSTEGAVTQVMDGLLSMHRATIEGEMIQQIQHNILGKGRLADIKYIYSHPQAIEQCREFLHHQLPEAILKSCSSTSEACKIALEDSSYGAIASSSAANIHGLNIIKADVQDNLMNQTRFIVIGREDTSPSGNDKTSIAFSFFDDFPGSLFQVLREFAEVDINLTRIESRPAKAELGRYIFYIDFKGHYREPEVARVIENIKGITNKFLIFGSYPIGANI